MPLQPLQAAVMRRGLADKLPEAQKQAESRYAQEEIKPTPETVSATSSMHPVFVGEVTDATKAPQGSGGDRDVDTLAGVKHDLVGFQSMHLLRTTVWLMVHS
jgi:hypothetical protein